MAKTTIPDAPDYWLDSTRELWERLAGVKAKSTSRLELLRQGLEARDRAEKARAVVQAEGMTFKTETTGAVHVHPAVRIEKDSMATFARIWKTLNLEWSQEDGRIT